MPVCVQGDINHWVAVLDHFDSFFEQQVSQRNDVQLQAGDDPPFPTETCLAVLNTTCVLLENCSNKAAYNSSEVCVPATRIQRTVCAAGASTVPHSPAAPFWLQAAV